MISKNQKTMYNVTLTFDLRVYRLSAVKKTGYRFGDRCFVQIDLPSEAGPAHINVVEETGLL